MKPLASRFHSNSQATPPRHSRWTVPTDQVMAEERTSAFTWRSIKTSAKLEGLKLAVSLTELTTLEGSDTPGKVAFLCRKAMQPLYPRYQVTNCAAVSVYPNLVRPEEISPEFDRQSGVGRDCFPGGLMSAKLKFQEVRSAVSDSAAVLGARQLRTHLTATSVRTHCRLCYRNKE